ncbi:MAG: phosphate/phosphite/phosphonate ABC transporter substrate-binding protein [Alphaproteobacteria bacterium]|jgi:phosphonate transport system substrate-binding protein|nr:phosphate/phosphite/phosphonate ABC transporter substrate-binding protein [Alphaproteobacteria bacterium]
MIGIYKNLHRQSFTALFALAIFGVLSIIALTTGPASAMAAPVYTISRAPQLSPTVLAKIWQPYVDYLIKNTGYSFRLKLYGKRTDFEKDLVQGTPDFFYGNPGYFIVSHQLHNYAPLVRSGARQLKGIIVVSKDSPFQTIADLNGLSLAFPGPTALAASLYIRTLLKEREGIDFKPLYVGNHENVYRNVANKVTMAGGGVHRTLNREPEELRKHLRVIYETPGMSPHPISVHPRVPAAVATAVKEATLLLQTTVGGQKMLKNLKIQKPVAADFTKDYLSIEELALKMYAPLVSKPK